MRVTILGTGILGRAIAGRLRETGLAVTAYNRTRAKAEPLHQIGITIAESAQDAVRAADVVLVLLADASACESVLGGLDRLTGRTVVQMGTIGPAESRALEKTVTQKGGAYCEAPVLGSVAEAQAGTLLVLFGGAKEQWARLAEVFQRLSSAPAYVGSVGQAATLKLALNNLIAAETAAFALSLGLVQREHIEVEQFMNVLRSSALYAKTFDKKLDRLLRRDYHRPNFSTRHLLKDVQLIMGEAQTRGLATSGLKGTVTLLKQAIEHGLGDEDYSALFEAVNPRSDSAPYNK